MLLADWLYRGVRKQGSIPNHFRCWLGKSRVWGRRVAARPSGHCPPTFQHKSHKSHVCFQKSLHIAAKEPCIPSRKSPLLPINTKASWQCPISLSACVSICVAVHLCIYASMRESIYLCTYVSMNLRAYLWIYLFMYQSVFIYIYIYMCDALTIWRTAAAILQFCVHAPWRICSTPKKPCKPPPPMSLRLGRVSPYANFRSLSDGALFV